MQRGFVRRAYRFGGATELVGAGLDIGLDFVVWSV
jgi:hypothetical protein